MGNLLGKGIDIRVFEYHTKTVLLFEGGCTTMDFLSYLTTHQITELRGHAPGCLGVMYSTAIQPTEAGYRQGCKWGDSQGCAKLDQDQARRVIPLGFFP